MIILHTIKGQEFAINGGLIERVEQDNETHVTLANGTSYMVREPMSEVLHLHQLDRAAVRVLASRLARESNGRSVNEYALEGDFSVDLEPSSDDGLTGDESVDPQVHTIVQFPRRDPSRRQA